MTCGQRVFTPYGMGLIVGFRGWTDAIVSLDDGGYTTVPVPASDRTDVRFPRARAREISYNEPAGTRGNQVDFRTDAVPLLVPGGAASSRHGRD